MPEKGLSLNVKVELSGKEEFSEICKTVEKKYEELQMAIDKLNSFSFDVSIKEGD